MNENGVDASTNLIRLNRAWRGLSSQELANRAGITPAYLSKIESGKANPSLTVLQKLAGALGLPVEAILNGKASPASVARSRLRPTVVRHDARKTLRPAGSPVIYELLTPDLQRELQFIFVRHQPGEPVQYFSHQGEESILCLEGSFRMQIGDEEFVLGPGDCISFDSSVSHSLQALGDVPATLVSAQVPPSF